MGVVSLSGGLRLRNWIQGWRGIFRCKLCSYLAILWGRKDRLVFLAWASDGCGLVFWRVWWSVGVRCWDFAKLSWHLVLLKTVVVGTVMYDNVVLELVQVTVVAVVINARHDQNKLSSLVYPSRQFCICSWELNQRCEDQNLFAKPRVKLSMKYHVDG